MSNEKTTAGHAVASTYPEVDEIFELTIDFDASENQPLGMLRGDGYKPKGWDYRGKSLTGTQTRSFKLVQVGYCRNFEKLKRKLSAHGEIPEGQWRQAFKAAYPRSDGKGPVGVADSSWVSPRGGAGFPFVYAGGRSNFRWADYGFGGRWRWLVACK